MTGKDKSYDPLPIEDTMAIKSEKELRQMVDMFKATMGAQIEVIKLRAVLNKAIYDEHVKAGFTKEEALELVKVKGA